ncbi:helix-turn-helix domain-containing protein [Hoeflea sp.]|uniref:helix-turn-helix domain-containing protein n=1 Tax=Hoeflea sp. TaxID=1940281 RepID=UPI003B014E40
MKDPQDDLHQQIALFRYGVIADLVHLPVGTPGTGAMMRARAGKTYTIPGTTRTRVAAETMRHWIADYRRGGFDALYPKPRTDRGKPRRLPPEVAERLIALKTGNPACSVRAIINMAGQEGIAHPLAPSTVHRLLAREGLFDRTAPTDGADRHRFAYREAGELWMSDVMHGPGIRQGRSRRKTYLIAFIDDATRVVPFATFAMSENTSAFLPAFRNALIRRGLPARLYVDNGSAYRSRHLALVCARLGVALIHARAFQPAGKGKIERFFRSLRAGWLRHIDDAVLENLQTLNSSLWAWIEGEYHNAPHRGLEEGRTPLEQWAMASAGVRYPDATLDLDDLFLFEARRRVYKDRTVSLNGSVYEVDAVLVGQNVILRYDPAAPPSRPLEVVHDGKPAGKATRLDAYANTAVRRNRPAREIEADEPAPEPPPSPLVMRNLKAGKEDA